MTTRSWIRNLFARPTTRRAPEGSRKASSRPRLALEALEDRAVPATFTVLNTNDSGTDSLRQAILDATATAGDDTIVFGDGTAIGGTDFTDTTPDTITLTGGQLDLTNSGPGNAITIQGAGADLLSISGNHASRVFE